MKLQVASLSERRLGGGRSRAGTGRVSALLLIALALAVPSVAAASGFTAKLYAPTHTPKVGNERITVTVTRGTQKLSGSVNYHFLFDGQVVKEEPGHSFKGGVYHDTLQWPKDAVGHRITLQVVINTRYGTDYIDYWIQVRS
jgi:hypothetical protein